MMLRLLVILSLMHLTSCKEDAAISQPETLVEFNVSIESFRKHPPAEFKQLPQADQNALLEILNRDNADHGSHISFRKSKSRGNFRLAISIYEPYERNGRKMATGPMYGLEMKDGSWVITSIAID